jgi:hypothetical protein
LHQRPIGHLNFSNSSSVVSNAHAHTHAHAHPHPHPHPHPHTHVNNAGAFGGISTEELLAMVKVISSHKWAIPFRKPVTRAGLTWNEQTLSLFLSFGL